MERHIQEDTSLLGDQKNILTCFLGWRRVLISNLSAWSSWHTRFCASDQNSSSHDEGHDDDFDLAKYSLCIDNNCDTDSLSCLCLLLFLKHNFLLKSPSLRSSSSTIFSWDFSLWFSVETDVSRQTWERSSTSIVMSQEWCWMTCVIEDGDKKRRKLNWETNRLFLQQEELDMNLWSRFVMPSLKRHTEIVSLTIRRAVIACRVDSSCQRDGQQEDCMPIRVWTVEAYDIPSLVMYWQFPWQETIHWSWRMAQ